MSTKLQSISMDERKPLAERLARLCKKVMKQYDLGITALAKELKIHPATFYPWTQGTKCPKNRALYNEVIANLQSLDLTRAENAHKLRPELQLSLDLVVEEPEPVRVYPNPPPMEAATTGVTLSDEPEDAMLVLPKKEVLAIVSAGLNKLLLNGNYAVTGISFKGESGRIMFKEKYRRCK